MEGVAYLESRGGELVPAATGTMEQRHEGRAPMPDAAEPTSQLEKFMLTMMAQNQALTRELSGLRRVVDDLQGKVIAKDGDGTRGPSRAPEAPAPITGAIYCGCLEEGYIWSAEGWRHLVRGGGERGFWCEGITKVRSGSTSWASGYRNYASATSWSSWRASSWVSRRWCRERHWGRDVRDWDDSIGSSWSRWRRWRAAPPAEDVREWVEPSLGCLEDLTLRGMEVEGHQRRMSERWTSRSSPT